MTDDAKQQQIEIRTAGAADASLLSVLGIITFYEAYFEQDDPAGLAAYLLESFSPQQIFADLADPNTIFFIAYRSGKAVGYARLLGNSTLECIQGENPIELKRIYLVERVWGNGVGEKLLNHCITEAKRLGHDTLWLGCWQENRRGQRFYEKQGFRKVGTLEFPYGDEVGINDVFQIEL